MNTIVLLNTIFTTLSLISSLLVILVHLAIRKLLRPPGDLIFTQSITQAFLCIHWYSMIFISDLPASSTQCKLLATISTFSAPFSLNLLLCLCLEIHYKLENRAYSQSKLRRRTYYALNLFYSGFLTVLAYLHGDFGHGLNETCALKTESLTSYIRFCGFLLVALVQMLLIARIVPKIDKTYSKLTYNCFVFVCFVSLSLIFSNLFKFLTIFYKDETELFFKISSLSGTSTGILIAVIRLWNKQLIKQLKWKICFRKRASAKIGLTTAIFEDFYNIGDLFESITNKTLLQMILVVNLRMKAAEKQLVDIENEKDYSEFNYDEKLFDQLCEEYGTLVIKDLYSPDLYLQEFAPTHFAALRKHLKISDFDLYESFSISANIAKLLSVQLAEGGRSQATIFFTSDKKFLIKTISKSEQKFLIRSLLPEYFRHTTQNSSFLVRILALFRVNPAKVTYIVMENTISESSHAVTFDIKGSTVNRIVSGCFDYSKPPYGMLLKDLNLKASEYKLELGEEAQKDVIRTLTADLELLAEMNATDYSVLIAFYDPSCQTESRYLVRGLNQNYSVSIIDFLQRFNRKKQSEKFIKKLYYKEEFSVEEPKYYKSRLLSFFQELI